VTTGPGEELVGELVDALTVDEAAALCAGFDMWRNHRVKRLGLGAIKVSDGPVGVRGDGPIGSGTPSVVLPCPTAMGATWDPALVRSAGEVLADEVRDRQASVLLAPTVNLHRTPLAGRNFECFSEDPHLTAELAAAYIDGVQSSGVSACVKHFVANDQEWERHSISAEVSERALRELYLLPFEVAVTRARVWMVMSAYNRLGGTFCSEHRWLLTDVLRGEWGFDGAVVSDWGGTHSTVPAALGGLDWQMPGPPTRFGPPLADAVRAGEVPEDVVRAMAANVLGVARRTSLLDGERTPGKVSPESPERSVDRPEARALARSIAAASMVLLGNRDGALPLDPAPVSIAVGFMLAEGTMQTTATAPAKTTSATSLFVPFAAKSARLTPTARKRIVTAMTELGATAPTISLVGYSTRSASPASVTLANARMRAIATYLRSAGFGANVTLVPTTAARTAQAKGVLVRAGG
jgi:beta-glucosidase